MAYHDIYLIFVIYYDLFLLFPSFFPSLSFDFFLLVLVFLFSYHFYLIVLTSARNEGDKVLTNIVMTSMVIASATPVPILLTTNYANPKED